MSERFEIDYEKLADTIYGIACRAWRQQTLLPMYADQLRAAIRIADEPVKERPCTCHPDDKPPVPCARKYALSECKPAPAKDAERILAGMSPTQKEPTP